MCCAVYLLLPLPREEYEYTVLTSLCHVMADVLGGVNVGALTSSSVLPGDPAW